MIGVKGKATYETPFAALPHAMVQDPGISVNAKIVYAAIATHAPNPYPSREKIASYLGCSISTVKRALKEIEAAGWVKVEYRYDKDGRRTSNGYTLLSKKRRLRLTGDPIPGSHMSHKEEPIKKNN